MGSQLADLPTPDTRQFDPQKQTKLLHSRELPDGPLTGTGPAAVGLVSQDVNQLAAPTRSYAGGKRTSKVKTEREMMSSDSCHRFLSCCAAGWAITSRSTRKRRSFGGFNVACSCCR